MFPDFKRQDSKYSPELRTIPIHSGSLRNNLTFETGSSPSSHSNSRSENIYLETYRITEEPGQTTPQLKQKKSVVFHHDLVTGCAENEDDQAENEKETSVENEERTATSLELNTTENCSTEVKHRPNILWPVTQNNYISTSSCTENSLCCSPEILTTRVCVELGVMKNPMCSPSPGNENSSTVVICSVDVEPCPGHLVELNEVKFTTNTIGEICVDNTAQTLNEIHKDESISISTDMKEKADVLDRISQDLDYLLNRSPSPSKTRKHGYKNSVSNAKSTSKISKLS